MYIDYIALGRRIKIERKKLKITQAELSEKIDKCNEYISKIENGKVKPSLEVLASICVELNADIGYILSGTIYKSPTYLKIDVLEKLKECSPEQKKLISELADKVLSYSVDKKD